MQKDNASELKSRNSDRLRVDHMRRSSMKESGWNAFGVVLPLAMLVASACGSDEGDGAGGKCSQGATRACLGPAACDGAQSCGADGTWSACDCGGTGGAGGVGGAGGNAGVGGVGGGNGGTGGVDASAGSGGASGDASADAADGGTQWKDDPCPSSTPLINCSSSCGGPSGSCSGSTCPGYYILDTMYPQFPYVIRTPSKPGVDSKCVATCSGAGPTFGIGLYQGKMKIKPNTGFKVTVPKPWYVLLTGDGYPTEFCKIGLAKQDCSVWASNTPNVLILTDDPNAPAVNVILEETSWPTSCP